MSGLVLDSSFVIALMVVEEHSTFAIQLLDSLAPDKLEAPVLIVWEVANVLDKKVRQKLLSADDRLRMLSRFDELPLEFGAPPDAGDLRQLAALCDVHGLTAYDGAYLALALEARSALATLDRRLAAAARAEGLTVHSPF